MSTTTVTPKEHLAARRQLRRLQACQPAMAWFKESRLKPQEAWESVPRSAWMYWLIYNTALMDQDILRRQKTLKDLSDANREASAVVDKFSETKKAARMSYKEFLKEANRRQCKVYLKYFPKVPVFPVKL